MAIDPIIGAAVEATTGAIQTGIQRYWNLKDYATQRRDALADWNRQNEYNSPIAQMTRYKEAGLNPNLIYGQMQNSSPMRGPSLQETKVNNPFSGITDTYLNALTKKQQVDNMKINNQLLAENVQKTKLENESKSLDIQKKSRDIGLINEFGNEYANSFVEGLRKAGLQNDVTVSNAIASHFNSYFLQETYADRVKTVKQNLDNMVKEIGIKKKLSDWQIKEAQSRIHSNTVNNTLKVIEGNLKKAQTLNETYKGSILQKDKEYYLWKLGANVGASMINTAGNAIKSTGELIKNFKFR